MFYIAIFGMDFKTIKGKEHYLFDSEEELKILAELGEEEGTLQEEESDMIQSIFDFTENPFEEQQFFSFL